MFLESLMYSPIYAPIYANMDMDVMQYRIFVYFVLGYGASCLNRSGWAWGVFGALVGPQLAIAALMCVGRQKKD